MKDGTYHYVDRLFGCIFCDKGLIVEEAQWSSGMIVALGVEISQIHSRE